MNPGKNTILSSQWGELSDFLIAKFYAVDEKGRRMDGEPMEVHAPLVDGNQDITMNWQSPFESASPDTKAPALAGMLQSGALATIMSDLTNAKTGVSTPERDFSSSGSLENALDEVKGRTGITKLNSVQIFTGMAPVRFTFSLQFRAMSDPYSEVELPINQLTYWALPRKLSSDSIIKRAAGADGILGYIKALLPSQAPTMIAMEYKGCTYAPLVIESIGSPMTAPIASNGYHTNKAIALTVCSLTALDRNDFKEIFSR
jgi:hypothetical protein